MLSDKCEPVSEWPVTVALCRTELAPLSESVSAVKLEVFSAVEVAFLIEMVVNGGMDGGEFLQASHARTRSIARSRRRNGSCEFSALLLSQRPVSCLSTLPMTFIAAP